MKSRIQIQIKWHMCKEQRKKEQHIKFGFLCMLCSTIGQVGSVELGESIPASDVVYTGELTVLCQDYSLNGLALWMQWDLGIRSVTNINPSNLPYLTSIGIGRYRYW